MGNFQQWTNIPKGMIYIKKICVGQNTRMFSFFAVNSFPIKLEIIVTHKKFK